MVKGRRPRQLENYPNYNKTGTFVFVIVLVLGTLGVYHLNQNSNNQPLAPRESVDLANGYMPLRQSQPQAVDFGFGKITACVGDPVTVQWKGTHNLQETEQATCQSASVGIPLSKYHPAGHNRTFSKNELVAKPGHTRYFKCDRHCATQEARFEVSCPCRCTKELQPVCCNGQTYSNQCLAACDGCERPEKGSCPCICTEQWQPVCCNGQTYSNNCFAACHGCKDHHPPEGECSRT